MSAIAHVKQAKDGCWVEHSVDEHLYGVSALAQQFAAQMGASEWARLAGLWHDLGKYQPAFQSYIKRASGYDPEAHIEQGSGRVDHSTPGALYASRYAREGGRLLSYLIAGHHTGLPDWDSAEEGARSLSRRLADSKVENGLNSILQAEIPSDIMNPSVGDLTKPLGGREGLHLWLRMLFSCLVDADFLDTERFMNPQSADARGSEFIISELKHVFDSYIERKITTSEVSEVNKWRATVLADCRQAANDSPGAFTLTVPTGGGKTLSSMAFALGHASKFSKQRIIVAIPYTSIIEQTAEQYREIFGDAVLEHHSSLDPDKAENEKARTCLAAENWDSPIVVTTNVQLLESLFAARASRCRKIHNIINSVIVLDEAQLLPPEFLQPILDIFRLLTEHYGVTLVLCTATQPALNSRRDTFGKTVLRGLDAKREIVGDVEGLFAALDRVEVRRPANLHDRSSWESIAEEMATHPTVLGIVNSRRDALALHSLMPKDTLHLSARMCGAHRSRVISLIKRKLKAGESVRVVSTQLVEAGVDLDFPVVYRALTGLDSLAQAAGRCNREGRLPKGQVVVFNPPESPKRGTLLYAENATRSVWHHYEGAPLSHALYSSYFEQFFRQESLDKHGILQLLTQDAGQCMVQFRTTAERFRVIDDITRTVIVPFGDDGFKWIDILRSIGPERYIMRKLQRFCVSIYENEFQELKRIGAIEEIHLGVWAVVVTNAYDEDLGLLSPERLYCNKSQDLVF